jgi:hypothetical protein
MARFFKQVVRFSDEVLMVQITDGVNAVLDPIYTEAARTLGMTAIQELISGA